MTATRPSITPIITADTQLKMYRDGFKARLDENKQESAKLLFKTAAERGHTLSVMELGRFCVEVSEFFSDHEKMKICVMLAAEAKKDNLNASVLIAKIEADDDALTALLASVEAPGSHLFNEKHTSHEIFAELASREHKNLIAQPPPANLVHCQNQIFKYERLAFEAALRGAAEEDLTSHYYLYDSYRTGRGTQRNHMAAIHYFLKAHKALELPLSRSEYLSTVVPVYKHIMETGDADSLCGLKEVLTNNYPLYELQTPVYSTYPQPVILEEAGKHNLFSYLMGQEWIYFKPDIFNGYLIELALHGFQHPAFPYEKPGCEQTAENSEYFSVHKALSSRERYDVGVTKIIMEYAEFNLTRGNNLLFWQKYKHNLQPSEHAKLTQDEKPEPMALIAGLKAG